MVTFCNSSSSPRVHRNKIRLPRLLTFLIPGRKDTSAHTLWHLVYGCQEWIEVEVEPKTLIILSSASWLMIALFER